MASNLDFLATHALEAKHLDGKYMRVRHEDFSVAPLEVASEIYNFIGMKMTSEVIALFLNFSFFNLYSNIPLPRL